MKFSAYSPFYSAYAAFKAVPFPFRNTRMFPIGNAVPLDDAGECG